jgi:hypothetical protein
LDLPARQVCDGLELVDGADAEREVVFAFLLEFFDYASDEDLGDACRRVGELYRPFYRVSLALDLSEDDDSEDLKRSRWFRRHIKSIRKERKSVYVVLLVFCEEIATMCRIAPRCERCGVDLDPLAVFLPARETLVDLFPQLLARLVVLKNVHVLPLGVVDLASGSLVRHRIRMVDVDPVFGRTEECAPFEPIVGKDLLGALVRAAPDRLELLFRSDVVDERGGDRGRRFTRVLAQWRAPDDREAVVHHVAHCSASLFVPPHGVLLFCPCCAVGSLTLCSE